MNENLVDSCGWLEYFSDGKNADFFCFRYRKHGTSDSPYSWLWTQDIHFEKLSGVKFIKKSITCSIKKI